MRINKTMCLFGVFVFVLAFPVSAQNKAVSCKKALSLGYTCEITDNADGTKTREVCKEIKGITSSPSNKKVCTNTVFKEGVKQTQTICDSTDATGKCKIQRERFYNGKGLLVSDRGCSSAYQGTNKQGSYTVGVEYSYRGKDLVSLKLCKQYDAEGKCVAYDRGIDKTYDNKHKLVKTRKCLFYGPKGECRNPSGEENIYNDKGQLIYSKRCYVYEEGDKCRSYGPGIDYKYDKKNNIIAERDCQTYNENNVCTQYRNSGFEYTYDDRNNRVAAIKCSYDKEGKCKSFGGLSEFIYDEDNVLITEKFCRSNNLDADTGKCSKYDSSYYNALFL